MDELQTLADKLLRTPAYIIRASDGRLDALAGYDCLACTSRTLDLLYRDWLDARGLWQGRRPAIFVDDEQAAEITAQVVADEGGDATAITARILAAAVIHEVAHVVEHGIDTSEPTADRATFAHNIAAFSVAIQDVSRPKSFEGHNATWARLCAHAHHRAAVLGVDVPPWWVYSGEAYGIPELADVIYALDGEPRNLARESIFQIPTFTPRLSYRRMWEQVTTFH